MSLYYDQDNYDLSSSVETGGLLAELPFELIKESIMEQIADPMSTNINYIDTIVDKCNMYLEEYSDDEDVVNEVNEQLRDFFVTIITEIDNKFSLGLDINDISSYTNFVEIGEVIYKYFILRYKKNITKFITKFIFSNKKTICGYYADKTKKDVSTLAFKKQIKNPDDLCILTNLPSIMRYIIELDIEPLQFVELSSGQDNYEAGIIKQLIKSGKLIGDFYEQYMEMCMDSHDYIIDELQTDIRIKILNKITK